MVTDGFNINAKRDVGDVDDDEDEVDVDDDATMVRPKLIDNVNTKNSRVLRVQSKRVCRAQFKNALSSLDAV